MKTTIAKVTLTAVGGQIRFSVHGTVVARGQTVDNPGCYSDGLLYPGAWKHVFGSEEAARALADVSGGASVSRKLRLTTLGYDRDDRVVC